MTKEEIFNSCLNKRCKYNSSKQLDYDAYLAVMDAMEMYLRQETEIKVCLICETVGGCEHNTLE